MHYRMFRSMPGLYLLDASSILLIMTTKNVFRHGQISPGKATSPTVENHCSTELLKTNLAESNNVKGPTKPGVFGG